MSQRAGKDLFERLAGAEPDTEPQRLQCAAITRKGERCKAWALTGGDKCAGHAGLYRLDPERGQLAARDRARKQAEERRQARLSVRERAAEALSEDWPDVLEALRAGVKEGSAAARARAAIGYVQLVYGRQLQAPADEQPATTDELDVAAMTREQREELKRRLLAEQPELASRLMVAGDD